MGKYNGHARAREFTVLLAKLTGRTRRLCLDFVVAKCRFLLLYSVVVIFYNCFIKKLVETLEPNTCNLLIRVKISVKLNFPNNLQNCRGTEILYSYS